MTTRILKRAPAMLFRYRPPGEVTNGYFDDLLRTNEFFTTPPRKFKDDFDCRASIDSRGTRSEWLRYWKHNGHVLGLTGKAKARLASEAVNTGAWKDPAKHEEVKNAIQACLDNSGVVCLTENPLSGRMWDEYAEGGKGICLCFESFGSPFDEMLDVQYLPAHPTVRFNATPDELVEAFLLVKTSPYVWEREWRKVYFNEGGGPKSIPASSLRAVLLGPAISSSDRHSVLQSLAKWKPHVFVLEAQSIASELTLVPVVHGRSNGLMPPIKEWVEPEPEGQTDLGRLREHLAAIPATDRRTPIDDRVQRVLQGLEIVLSLKRPPRPSEAADVRLALREARNVYVDLVDLTGGAPTGYGPIAILLYRMVRAIELTLPPGATL
jgi:hypothetical protein